MISSDSFDKDFEEANFLFDKYYDVFDKNDLFHILLSLCYEVDMKGEKLDNFLSESRVFFDKLELDKFDMEIDRLLREKIYK